MMHQNTFKMEYLLNLSDYKKNPKKLYKQLVTLQEKAVSPTGKRVTTSLISEFIKQRSPEEYPELWV